MVNNTPSLITTTNTGTSNTHTLPPSPFRVSRPPSHSSSVLSLRLRLVLRFSCRVLLLLLLLCVAFGSYVTIIKTRNVLSQNVYSIIPTAVIMHMSLALLVSLFLSFGQ